LADALVARWGFPPFRRGERARVTEGEVDGVPVRVLKPTTYMNSSGAERAGPDREARRHQDEEVPVPVVERRSRERGEGRAARVHVGGGLEHADGYAVHLTSVTRARSPRRKGGSPNARRAHRPTRSPHCDAFAASLGPRVYRGRRRRASVSSLCPALGFLRPFPPLQEPAPRLRRLSSPRAWLAAATFRLPASPLPPHPHEPCG